MRRFERGGRVHREVVGKLRQIPPNVQAAFAMPDHMNAVDANLVAISGPSPTNVAAPSSIETLFFVPCGLRSML